MSFKILSATVEEVKYLDDKIDEFNLSKIDHGNLVGAINFVIKNEEKVIAGITSWIYFHTLGVNILFVEEQYRNHGLGSKLIEKLEEEASGRGIKLIHLDTFDFQAKDFYLKHGYEVFGVLDDSPTTGHKRYYMKKVLL